MSENSKPVGTVLFTKEQIEARAVEIGAQISSDYAGEEVYLVGTLKGAIMWMADIMKNITCDTEIDFVVASSYGSGTTTSGVVKIKKDLDGDIYGKNIIIIEDIVDTGTTLKYLKEHVIDNLFVIGYGLDYDQKYRNLPYVGYLEG
jgi:hypoxanthine phosphoribosyltransferase